MYLKVLLVTFALILQLKGILTQRQWVLPTTTAAEMWNPATWYRPYYIAAAEAYREYFQNAQQISNQLYIQAYNTNAFWWANRPGGGGPAGGIGGAAGQAAGGAAGAAGQAAGAAGGAAGQAAGAAGGAAGQAAGAAGGAAGQAAGAAGGAAGQAAGAAGGAAGQAGGRPIANMAQGGAGWN